MSIPLNGFEIGLFSSNKSCNSDKVSIQIPALLRQLNTPAFKKSMLVWAACRVAFSTNESTTVCGTRPFSLSADHLFLLYIHKTKSCLFIHLTYISATSTNMRACMCAPKNTLLEYSLACTLQLSRIAKDTTQKHDRRRLFKGASYVSCLTHYDSCLTTEHTYSGMVSYRR